jgi:3-hydroxyisobutyrate dehydrogenase/2-hydroxy-3-oxopropionate reductase
MAAPTVGFIGLGKMGRPMTMRLLAAGFRVTVHNRSQGVVQELARAGAQPARSAREVSEAADIVLTCLPTPPVVEEIFLAEDGVAAGGKAGQIWVDHSTVSPSTNRRCAEAAAAVGATFLDAPVSGGPEGAAAGTLAIMVGGDDAAFDRARPVFEAMGQNIRRCGPSGAGTAVKLVNQLLVGIHTAAAAEAVVLGVKAGADPQIILDLISTSYGASRMLSRNLPLQIARDWTPTTPVSVILKDLLLIHEFARDQGARLLLGGMSLELFKEAVQLGHGNKDMSAMALPLEQIAQTEIHPKKG